MTSSFIIAGYPGVGKTHFTEHNLGVKILDLDSSQFPKDAFPENYLETIQENIGLATIIFVSTHEDVQKGLLQRGMPYTIVYPNINLKEDYMARYRKRNDTTDFCKQIDTIWNPSIQYIQSVKNKNVNKIQLKACQTLTDVVGEALLFEPETEIK